jgi:hypothetical protein
VKISIMCSFPAVWQRVPGRIGGPQKRGAYSNA